MMFDIAIEQEHISHLDGTSEGTQLKYYMNGFWYKIDTCGEGKAEYLVSRLLTFTDLPTDTYVLYENGWINHQAGCRSRNFLKPGQELMTLERLHQYLTGQKLSAKRSAFDKMESFIEYTLNFFTTQLGLDLYLYFKRIFSIDYITLNEDRHFNNLAAISDINIGKFIPAPIFDNGRSLLCGCQGYRDTLSLEENIKRVTARPFSGSHKKQFNYFGIGFKLDQNKAIEWLQEEEPCLPRDVLLLRLNQIYENQLSM